MNTKASNSLRKHLLALSQRKADLEIEIATEMQKPMPCTLTLQNLKRQRLSLKDHIANLAGHAEQSAANQGS